MIPTPAATRPPMIRGSSTWHATRGSNPARTQAVRMTPTPTGAVPTSQRSSESCRRSSGPAPTSGWDSGSATCISSVSRCSRSIPSGRTPSSGSPSNTTARSSSPARSRVRQALDGASTTASSTSGWRSWKRVSASSRTVAPAVGKVPMRRRPERSSVRSPSFASAAARWPAIASAWSSTTRPASVRLTPRAARLKSCAPASRSSAAICRDTAGCVIQSAWAAPEIVPRFATSLKICSRRASIML